VPDVWKLRLERINYTGKIFHHGSRFDVMSHKNHIKGEGIRCRVEGQRM